MSFLFKMFSGGDFKNLAIADYQTQFGNTPHTLVDVRTTGEYQQGHLPKAINIPLDQLSKFLNEIPKDKPVVCVCASGSRSSSAANILSQAGYENVYNLSGGTVRWMMQKLPLER